MAFGDIAKQQLVDFFTNYETRARVILRSAWLRIPQLLIIWGLVMYIFAKELLWNLKLMTKTPVDPLVQMTVLQRLHDDLCEERQLDCPFYVYNLSDTTHFPYCRPCKELNISGCIPFFGVSPSAGATGAFVPTMYTQFTQRFSHAKGWQTFEVSRNFTIGIEFVAVHVTHAFGKRLPGLDDAERFVEFANGTVCKLRCKRTQNCPQGRTALSKRVSDCPGDESHMLNWGDSLSFGLHLSAINLSLDTETKHKIHTAPLRYWGTTFGLEVKYTNADSQEFWTWPFGPKLVYIYRPLLLSLQKETQTCNVDVPPSFPSEGDTRVVQKRSGVFIQPQREDHILTFTWLHALAVMVVSLSGISLAHMVVETILVRVYKMFDSLQHVAILYHLYSSNMSPLETEMKDVVINQHVTPSQKAELLKKLHSQTAQDREHEFLNVQGLAQDEFRASPRMSSKAGMARARSVCQQDSSTSDDDSTHGEA